MAPINFINSAFSDKDMQDKLSEYCFFEIYEVLHQVYEEGKINTTYFKLSNFKSEEKTLLMMKYLAVQLQELIQM
jgi:hypothetical protein